ncbi:hypothetical protein cyc_07610 [Cyclospora cayetanensis]|uniref:Uncharacterized protein n=1 Tax=Cyclospora cayetanensis TaxID=88456 RepID=A0A1D3CT14_9EIME|nr:hypothetical protein cyc_07610 [Cyclospora cayetanensis]
MQEGPWGGKGEECEAQRKKMQLHGCCREASHVFDEEVLALGIAANLHHFHLQWLPSIHRAAPNKAEMHPQAPASPSECAEQLQEKLRQQQHVSQFPKA